MIPKGTAGAANDRLGNNLQWWIAHRGYSKPEFLARAMLSANTFQAFLKGNPTLRIIQQAADALEIDIAELFIPEPKPSVKIRTERPWTPRRLITLERMRADGFEFKVIAKRLGCGPGTCRTRYYRLMREQRLAHEARA